MYLPRGAAAALAGQYVHLPERGWDPVSKRCLRTTPLLGATIRLRRLGIRTNASRAKVLCHLITPLSQLVLKKLDEVKTLGLLDKIKVIAPSHGQRWTDPAKIINAYTGWATGKAKNKATIVYDTMHYSTQKMAHALAEGLIAGGVDVAVYSCTPTNEARLSRISSIASSSSSAFRQCTE